MPKSTKRFTLSSNAMNSQRFRVLTSGACVDEFEKNPVLLFNHIRPKGSRKTQILPLGHWEDLQIDDEIISAIPVFDDKDEFAMSIYHKVEAGHMRMASAGLEPLETSTKKSDLLPGQKLATVTKWILKEGSICDIGANPDALAVALYDKNGRTINLSETSIETLIPKIETMAKKTQTVAEAMASIKKAADAKKAYQTAVTLCQTKIEIALADDDATEDEKKELADAEKPEEEKLSDDDKDVKIDELTKQLADAQEQLAKLQEQLKLADEDKQDKAAEQLAFKGKALRKLSDAQIPSFIKMAKADLKAAESYLDSIKVAPSARDTVDTKAAAGDKQSEKILKLSDKGWDELFKNGDTAYLKLHAADVYAAKYKEKFGKDPK